MTAWISAQAAYAHVLGHEILPDVTTTKLTDAIVRRKIPARASILLSYGQQADNSLIPAEFWGADNARFRFDFHAGLAERKSLPIASGMVSALTGSASGLEFSARHLYAIWPALDVEPPKTPKPPRVPYEQKNATGRPSKWDWTGAAIELACEWNIRGIEHKTQAEILKHIAQWFVDSTGSAPADSEIRENVVKRFMNAMKAAGADDEGN